MRLKIKSEAFFKNYLESNGESATYYEGYMDTVALPGDEVSIVNGMRREMGKSSELYTCLSGYYYCLDWNWPLWMCEEVEDEDKDKIGSVS